MAKTGEEQEFDYGIINNAVQEITTPTMLVTHEPDGNYGKTANFSKAFINSNESLALAQRKDDVLYGILDQYTGEEMTLSKVTGTPTVDGVIYFQLGSEYFKRDYEQIRVEWFGAVGDGTADDTAEFVLAMAAGSGQDVLLTPGKTYIITDDLDTVNVNLIGYGATLKVPNGATVNFNGILHPSNGCSIRGLTIDLNKSNTTNPASQILGNGIYMNPVSWSNLLIKDVTIINGWSSGIFLSGQGGSPFDDDIPTVSTTIDGCKITNCTDANFLIKHARGVSIKNCTSSFSDLGYYFTNVGECSVVNSNGSDNLRSGVSITYSLSCTISNNVFERNGDNGITLGGGSVLETQNQQMLIIGNTVVDSGEIGITIDPTVAGFDIVPVFSPTSVVGNIVKNSILEGINLEQASNVTVSGNLVENTTMGRAGIRTINGRFNVIANNDVIDCGDYGIAVYGNAGNDVGHTTVVGNRVSGSAIAEYNALDPVLVDILGDFNGANGVWTGAGSPEGVISAPIGSTYRRTDGSNGTVFYTKESGAGNTGWATSTDRISYGFFKMLTGNGHGFLRHNYLADTGNEYMGLTNNYLRTNSTSGTFGNAALSSAEIGIRTGGAADFINFAFGNPGVEPIESARFLPFGRFLVNATVWDGVSNLQVGGSIGATTYNGSATLTGTPTAPTATAGTNTTQIATTAFVQGIRPYKIYTALLTQTGTDAPTDIVQENTLGGTIVWSYSSTGVYIATLSGAFTTDKTTFEFTNGQTGNYSVGGYSDTTSTITVGSVNAATNAATNGAIWRATVKIKVYN